MKNLEKQARDALLYSGYGKYDLIIYIIPQELLLSGKPRRIKEWIIKNLQVNAEAINENTLRGWLYRYRKSHQRILNQPESKTWQNFEPAAFKAVSTNEKIVIKKIPINKTYTL